MGLMISAGEVVFQPLGIELFLGVIKSAIDSTARSVTTIAEELRHGPTLDELKTSRKLRDSLAALESNNPVTVAASDRLSTPQKTSRPCDRLGS